MKKKFKPEHLGLIIFALLILGSGFFISLLIYYFTPQVAINFNLAKRQISIEADYEQNIRNILNRYARKRARMAEIKSDLISKEWTGLLNETKNQLLGLQVGSNSLNKHLSLVLELEKMQSLVSQGSLQEARIAEGQLIKLFN